MIAGPNFFGNASGGSSGGGSSSSDSYFSNVVLLLHCNGSNGDTATTDSSSYARTINAAGTVLPTLSSADKKFGSTSMLFTGAGNSAFTTPSSADFSFGTGDFTIEFWMKLASVSTSPYLIAHRLGGLTQGWYIACSNSNEIGFGRQGTVNSFNFSSFNAFTNGQWWHIAFSRTSGVLKLFINGVQDFSLTDTTDYSGTSTNPLAIGRDATSGNNVDGYMDEIRITKGVGRYSANFTPQTAEF